MLIRRHRGLMIDVSVSEGCSAGVDAGVCGGQRGCELGPRGEWRVRGLAAVAAGAAGRRVARLAQEARGRRHPLRDPPRGKETSAKCGRNCRVVQLPRQSMVSIYSSKNYIDIWLCHSLEIFTFI